MSKDTYEMALDIIDADPLLDINVELAEAKVQLLSKWPDIAEMPRLWQAWILMRRQGVSSAADVSFYGNPARRQREVIIQTGWAGMQEFNKAIQKEVARGCSH